MVEKNSSSQDGFECPRCGNYSPIDAVECSECNLIYYPQNGDEVKGITEWWNSDEDDDQEFQQYPFAITTGSKIVSIAASFATIGFFLPWVLVSCNGEPIVTMTGNQIASGGRLPTTYGLSDPLPGNPLLFAILGASILTLLLFIIYYVIRRFGLLTSIFQTALGIIGVSSMIVGMKKLVEMYSGEGEYMWVPVVMTVQTLYGAWITAIGLTGIIIGSILSIADFSRRGKKHTFKATANSTIADQIIKLAELHKSGLITNEEYEAAKKKLVSS